MPDRDFYADILEALLGGEDDQIIINMLAHLRIDELQDLALAAGNLRQLCEIIEKTRQAAADPPPDEAPP